ncbi:hypothetical protein [Streptomyces sp. NPDC051572]|uniref:hypothetical protein n=1 Tax=Streptomyces sp. NPDC051572 TaxID=3155802 RepID=UPI00344B236A
MVTQLDELLLGFDPWGRDHSDKRSWIEQQSLTVHRLEAAIERIATPGSVYVKQLRKYLDESDVELKAPHVFAIASGLRQDMNEGWVRSTVELVHADMYSDYLEMADGLLAKGYKDPAAIVTGTSLEVHVRALCVKHSVDVAQPNGTPKKADTMNADLKKADAYDGLQQKQVTAWMDLRNQAAHGNYEKYDEHQVRLFIDGVRAFMIKYPA